MNKVKIVSVLTPISSNGGGENLLKDLCGFYERNGIEHEVLLLTASRPFEALLRENDIVYKKTSNIELSTTPSKLSYLAAFIKLLFYLHKTIASIKKYKPDVVVVHGFPGSFLIGIGTMLMGKNYKLVYVHHSFKSKESNVLGIIYQAVLNQYDQIVGVSLSHVPKHGRFLSEAFPENNAHTQYDKHQNVRHCWRQKRIAEKTGPPGRHLGRDRCPVRSRQKSRVSGQDVW